MHDFFLYGKGLNNSFLKNIKHHSSLLECFAVVQQAIFSLITVLLLFSNLNMKLNQLPMSHVSLTLHEFNRFLCWLLLLLTEAYRWFLWPQLLFPVLWSYFSGDALSLIELIQPLQEGQKRSVPSSVHPDLRAFSLFQMCLVQLEY